jgi:hypothetical protein
MRDLGLDRGRLRPLLPHGYALGAPAVSAPVLLATIRYTRSPSVFSDSSFSASFLRTTPEKNPRTECGCQPVDVMIVAIVAPLGRRSSTSTRACFELARLVRVPLRPAFGRTFDEACPLAVRLCFRLDMPELLSIVPAQDRAATT